MAAPKKKVYKKKERKNIPYGIVHIAASFNNTMISITDTNGNLVAVFIRSTRFSGFQKGNTVRCSAGRERGRPQSCRCWNA